MRNQNERFSVVLLLALILPLLMVSVPSSLMVSANGCSNWSDDFVGGAQQAWTVVDGGDSSTHLFQNSRYELHTESGDGSAKSLASYVNSSGADYVMQARIQRMEAGDNFLAYLMARANTATMSGYVMGASSDGSHFWFGKLTGGAYSSLAQDYIEATTFDPTDFQLKFAVAGNNLYGKVWTTGSPEPDHWQITKTDATYSSGVGGVMIATYPTLGWNVVQAAYKQVSLTCLSKGEVYVDGAWTGKAAGAYVELPGGGTGIFGYNAFSTIQAGINGVNTSGTVNVAAGLYPENLTVSKANLVLQSIEKWSAIIRPTTTGSWPSAAVYITADGVTIDGFEIDGSTVSNNGIFGFDTSGVTIKNNKVHGAVHEWDGCGIILMSWGHGGTVYSNRIEDNEVYDTGRMGIMVMDHDATLYTVTYDNTITGNTVHDVWKKATAWDDGGGGIQINVAKNCYITNNSVFDVQDGQRGIYIFGSASGNIITGNTLRDNPTGIQIWISGEQPNPEINWGGETATSPQVHNNNIYNNILGAQSTNLEGYTSMTLDASHNWWGHPSGPSHDSPVIYGDKVSANVNYQPWLIAQYTGQIPVAGFKIDTTSPLPNGDIGVPYSQTFTASGGTAPYLWHNYYNLPAWLSFGTDGLLSGTPTASGLYTFEVQARDADQGIWKKFALNVMSITLTADPADIIADGVSTSTLTATVKDGSGNPVPDGTDVVFTTSKGTVGSSTVTKQTIGGVATATLTSISSTQEIIADVSASSSGISKMIAVFFSPPSAPPITDNQTTTVCGCGAVQGCCTGGDINIDATGSHTITTVKYGGNPGGTPNFDSSGNYYDVHIDCTDNIASLSIQFSPAAADTVIYYWTGTEWRAVSNQVYADGVVTVTVTATTFPSLTDLCGLFFGSGMPTTPPPPPPPTPVVSSLVSTGPVSHGSSIPTSNLPQQAVALPNLYVQSAAVVDGSRVSAQVTNKGTASGSARIVLYVDGNAVDSKDVSLTPGAISTVTFDTGSLAPGKHVISVNNKSAGEVTIAGGSDTVFFVVLAAFVILIVGLFIVYFRKQRAV